jgi:hypothetical protein
MWVHSHVLMGRLQGMIEGVFPADQEQLQTVMRRLGLLNRLAAIRLMHVGAQHPSPHDALAVAEVMRGIRRAWKKPPAQKAPAVDVEIQHLVDAVEPQTLKGPGTIEWE